MYSKISIIVPVYNVEEYLAECLESIINQTYKNLEIILIDDGSTDKSGAICDEYSQRDSRIKVIHQENKGIGATRNVGLSHVTGEYIGWVDSDDIIDKNMYEVLMKNMIKENASISCCKHVEIKGKYEKVKYINNDNLEVVTGNQVINLIRGPITCYLWEKLYKREMFEDICFANQKVGEDFVILVDMLCNNPKVVITDACYYYYRIREGSSFNNNDIEGRKNLLKSDLLAVKAIKKKKYDDEKWMNYKMLLSNLVIYSQVKQISSKEAKQFIKEVRKNILKLLFKLPRQMNKNEKKECIYALAVVLKLK